MKTNKVFIVAELSANHNNSLDIAKKTISEISKSGADAVKVQTYKPDSLTMKADNKYFGPLQKGPWKGKTLYELFEKGSLPYEWHHELKEFSEKLGLIFFSSPFDKEGVDLLEQLEVEMYKIASPEINHIPLIEYVAAKKKPMIISTGMASLDDIDEAVHACRRMGNNDITLLKCTSEYPAPIEQANLLTIPNLKDAFGVKVGLSDHSYGATIPIVATALGICFIEKHFVLDRSAGGIDATFSLEPNEFRMMVNGVREAEKALGKVDYGAGRKNNLRKRSIFISKDTAKGEEFSEHNLKVLRPGYGLHPKHYETAIGKKARIDLKKGEPLKWEHLK